MLIFRGCEQIIKNQKDAHGRELQNGANKSQKQSIFDGVKVPNTVLNFSVLL